MMNRRRARSATVLAPLLAVMLTVISGAVQGAGGLILNGAGFGTFNDGQGQVCTQVPFEVSIIYLPDAKALAALTNAPQTGCMTNFGSTVFSGVIHYDTNSSPPVWIQFHCRGTEASGLTCTGSEATMTIGTYSGPGSIVSVSQLDHLSGLSFQGSFAAV